jgi:hypothetical protein
VNAAGRPIGNLCAVIAAFLMTSFAAPTAWAYPEWQLSTGATRCNQCHYAPGGGGLLTSYGRDADGEQLSTFGGNGDFAHGAVTLPSWLALGADLRGAFVDNDVQDPNGPTVAVFPMQADASARLLIPGTGLSAVGIVGLRGQVRDPDVLVPSQNYQPISTSQLISREHYVMYQPEVVGTYLRVGRFFAPFGIPFAEHILYVRRDLGFDELRETYNFSAGVVTPKWEMHVTLFAPDFIRHIGSDEHGVAVYSEARLADDAVAVGGQLRIAASPGLTRFILGGVGKGYVERLRTLFFTELDFVQQVFDSPAVPGQQQAVGLAGFTVLPLPGLMATLIGERNQIDLSINDAWTAADALVNWFPYAHVELQLVGRLQFPTGGDVAKTLFFQVHYFL